MYQYTMLRKSVWQNLHNHFTHDTYPKKLYLTLYNYLNKLLRDTFSEKEYCK